MIAFKSYRPPLFIFAKMVSSDFVDVYDGRTLCGELVVVLH